MDDLVERGGLYYEKFTDVPFTGEVTGDIPGDGWAFKDGKKEGLWVRYHDNGQLLRKETYEDGKEEGPWVWYYDNGQLKDEGTFKDGKEDGPWDAYHEDGTVNEQRTGTYKNGVKVD